ncbi:MAG: 16S rRNA (guanine(966)-N(2))-methyltransferase RsmD [Pseudomonadota bacterium]
MKIIAGRWRGRALAAPPGVTTRPTAARTREAVFSMLVSRLGDFDGLHVIDLFAGTGALGLEALSRGAAHCRFVERDRRVAAILGRNIDTLDAAGEVLVTDATSLPAAADPVDLAFLDAPYDRGLTAPALDALRDGGWLGEGSLLVVETSPAETGPFAGFETVVDRRFGKALVRFLRPKA